VTHNTSVPCCRHVPLISSQLVLYSITSYQEVFIHLATFFGTKLTLLPETTACLHCNPMVSFLQSQILFYLYMLTSLH